MKIIIILLGLFIFLKTLFYGIYEINEQNNKISGISIIVFSIAILVALVLVALFCV